MKRRHQVSYSILALAAVTIFGIRPADRTSAATPANLAKTVAPKSVSQAQIVKTYGNLPLSFEANQGQTDSRVKFLSRGGGYTLFLTGDEAVLALKKSGVRSQESEAGIQNSVGRHPRESGDPEIRMDSRLRGNDRAVSLAAHHLPDATNDGPLTTDSILRMKLVGANSDATVTGADELPGKTNYFIGNDPKKWRTNVPTYAKVRYSNVYPGVDLVYYGNQSGQLEYDFVVAPGADPKAITFDVAAGLSRHPSSKNGGVKPPLQIDANGDLILRADGGDIRFQKPMVYQEQSTVDSSQLTAKDETRHLPLATRHFLDGHYTLDAQNSVGFQVGAYDHTKPLVIDPAIAYSTFLAGTTNPSSAMAVAEYTDPQTGHVYAYVAGQTCATDFPTAGAEQATYGGSGCSSLLYGIAGGGDAFVTKFDPSASGAASVIYSTYVGGSETEYGLGIAVDSAGNAYVTGITQSPDFPTVNAYQTGGGVFLTKLSSVGSALLYSTTFLADASNAVAVDSAGRAYIAGLTYQPNMPTVNPYQATILGPALCCGVPRGNAFIAVLDTTKSGSASLVYSTYLGASSIFWPDEAYAVGVDPTGAIHVGGRSFSGELPVVSGFQGPNGAFYAKLNPSLQGPAQLVYSTYIGGASGPNTFQIDTVTGIAVDSAGNAYLTGTVGSSDFPTTSGALQCPGASGFVTKINPALSGPSSLLYSSVCAGGSGIAVDTTGDAFVVGSAGPGLPLVNPVMGSTNGVFQSLNAGQNWTGLTDGLTDIPIASIAVDASTSPRTLYAGTDNGKVFASTNGGLNWTQSFQLPPWPTECQVDVAVDPTNPSNIYAVSCSGLFRSHDRGSSWSTLASGLSNSALGGGPPTRWALTFDGGTLYFGANDNVYVLAPGAASWAPTSLGFISAYATIAIDPNTSPHTIYAGGYKSGDGGKTWTYVGPPGTAISMLTVDSFTSPSTLYAYDGYDNVILGLSGFPPLYKSTDGGNSWIALPDPGLSLSDLWVDISVDRSTTPPTIYVRDASAGIFKSLDGGNTWSNVLRAGMGAIALDPTTASPTTPATVYAANATPEGNAYVAELNPSGTALLFSTYLGGIAANTSGSGIALDASDNIYVTGSTSNPTYFPTVNAYQPIAANLLNSSGFITELGSQTLPTDSSGSVTTQVAVQTGTLAITFPSITGSTTSAPPTLTVTPLSSATTANFSLSNNLGAYDISTTATFSASTSNPVTLCFQALTVNDFSTFSNLKILHIVNGSPVNVTTSYNFATRTICGAVTSFSPFLLVKGPADQLNDLVRSVNESDTRHGIQNALDAKLQNALSALNSARTNSYSTVCNVMGAFISNVMAQDGNAITIGEATAFISAAKQIKATLGCQ